LQAAFLTASPPRHSNRMGEKYVDGLLVRNLTA
jgi:hypothetical protein